MDNTVLVSAHGLSRYYGRHRALDDVHLELKRGEILGLLGPNGAGKSTTMQILCGVLAPHTGTVEICGIDLAQRAVDAKRRLGYLPEVPPLYREAQIDEYLRFCARLRGVAAARVEEAVADVKTLCGLNEAGSRLIANLSKGYQQRVGLAQAIVHRPDVLILDEPTVGLDPNQIREVRALIRELGRRHAVILSTHILSEAQAVCSRVCILHQGRIVFDQSVKPANETLQLSLRDPPDRRVLECVPGVMSCKVVGSNTFHLAVSDLGAAAERLAERAAESGWGLRELKAAEPALEQTFVRLTCGDTVASMDPPP